MFLPLLALSAFVQPNVAPDCGQVTISRALVLARTSETVCIGRDPDSQTGQYLLRRTSTDSRGISMITWVRTRDCPAGLQHLQALEEVALPSPDLPGFGQELQGIALDCAAYRLTTGALYDSARGELVVESNAGTPLARWIDGTLSALGSCWRDWPDAAEGSP